MSAAAKVRLWHLLHPPSDTAVVFDTSHGGLHQLTIHFLDILEVIRHDASDLSTYDMLALLANPVQHMHWVDQLNMLKDVDRVRVLVEFYRESEGLQVVRKLFVQELDIGRSSLLNDMLRWMA